MLQLKSNRIIANKIQMDITGTNDIRYLPLPVINLFYVQLKDTDVEFDIRKPKIYKLPRCKTELSEKIAVAHCYYHA